MMDSESMAKVLVGILKTARAAAQLEESAEHLLRGSRCTRIGIYQDMLDQAVRVAERLDEKCRELEEVKRVVQPHTKGECDQQEAGRPMGMRDRTEAEGQDRE